MKAQVTIDWLTFSVKEADPAVVIQKYLGLDTGLFQDSPCVLPGYTQMLRFSDICVCYAPRENDYFHDMGVCVSMSGNGCRTFEAMSKLTFDGAADKQGTSSIVFPVLFQLLASDESANVSRVDVACDDRAGHLDMDDIVSKVQDNAINSRMQKRSVVQSLSGVRRDGCTVYIGAPSSDFRIRIYDKALEEQVDEPWIRVEMVMRGDNANAFVEYLVNSESVGKLAAQILNDKFSFIERDDSNITRCTVCVWWAAFVDELEAVHLVAREVIQHGVDRVNDWVTSQVGPSLAILFQTLGWPHIYEIARSAAGRLNSRQVALVSDFNSLKAACF